jgi:hypothetical protein
MPLSLTTRSHTTNNHGQRSNTSPALTKEHLGLHVRHSRLSKVNIRRTYSIHFGFHVIVNDEVSQHCLQLVTGKEPAGTGVLACVSWSAIYTERSVCGTPTNAKGKILGVNRCEVLACCLSLFRMYKPSRVKLVWVLVVGTVHLMRKCGDADDGANRHVSAIAERVRHMNLTPHRHWKIVSLRISNCRNSITHCQQSLRCDYFRVGSCPAEPSSAWRSSSFPRPQSQPQPPHGGAQSISGWQRVCRVHVSKSKKRCG